MGGTVEEEAWFLNGRRMGGTGVECIFYHTVVHDTTCLVRGA